MYNRCTRAFLGNVKSIKKGQGRPCLLYSLGKGPRAVEGDAQIQRQHPARSRVYFLMELVSGGELLDALDYLGLLKDHQASDG